jgi:hypothetical protein
VGAAASMAVVVVSMAAVAAMVVAATAAITDPSRPNAPFRGGLAGGIGFLFSAAVLLPAALFRGASHGSLPVSDRRHTACFRHG